MKTLLALFALVIFTGCAGNPYKKFYKDETEGKELAELPVIIPTADPRLVEGTDPKTDYQKMTEDGYGMLGYSSFTGAISDQEDALKFAKTLHAEVVIVYANYTHTNSGVVPITTPTTQTSYTTANATAYGSNGNSAHVYGNGTTTTYGSQTNYIPYSVDQYNQGAQYWIKMKPRVFGANIQDLSEEKRQELASNKGVEIVTVIKESPAFNADFLRGDVIKRIGELEVSSIKSCLDALDSSAGKTVMIEFVRNGKVIKKNVTLNQKS